MIQTPGAKCGNRGQVKRALRISVTEGSGHVCSGKLNCPPLPSGDRGAGCEIFGEDGTSAGQNSGYEISGWNEGEFPFGWNERCHVLQGVVYVSKGEGATRHF